MTNCTEENNLSSSSTTPTEVPEDSSVFDNFASMNLELSNINEEDMRILRRVRIRSPPNIHMMNEVDDHSISGDEKEDTSVSNQVDPDEVNLPIVKCPVCDFNIEVSTDRSVDYDAYNMICPVCDESLEEDAIRMVQNSSFPISQKWIWKPREKNGVKNVHWALHDKKDASREHNKHEQMPDSISPALTFRENVYLQSLNNILSDEEDTISNASDDVVANDTFIAKSIGTDATDTSDVLDVQERSNRADFSQELLMSTFFLE